MASISDWCFVFWMGIMVIINIVLIISLITSFYKNRGTTSASKKQQLLLWWTNISILLFMLTGTFYFIGGMIVVTTSNRVLAKKYANIGDPTDMLSTPFMLFVFIIRLDVTFVNTKYQYSKSFMKILYIISILLFILALILSVNYVSGQVMGQPMSLLFGIVWMLMEWVLSILLIIIFLRKLNVLLIETANAYTKKVKTMTLPIKPQNDANDFNDVNNVAVNVKDKTEEDTFYSMTSTSIAKEIKSEDNKNNTYESVVTSEQIESVIHKKLLDNMIQNSILVPTAIISSFIILLISFMLVNIFSDNDIVMYPGMYILWVFDSTLNAFCLFCFLPFNHSTYYKFCGALHRCCIKRKIKKMKNSNQIVQVINHVLENQETEEKMKRDDVDADMINDMNNIGQTITV